jgi:hypothetical protein
MSILKFENDGPLLLASNYWQSEMAAAGKLSQSQHAVISDMRPGAKHIVVSMLPRDKWADREYCLEWMVEDGSDTPWACHLSPGQVDRAPNHEDVGKEWRGSVWDFVQGRPHKCLERSAFYQIVPELPWLRKISN